MKTARSIVLPSLTLLTGGMIYIFFRADSLRMFSWFDAIEITSAVDLVRMKSMQYSGALPDWLVYSAPDGLWMFSATSLMLVVWRFRISIETLAWLSVIPFISIGSEIGQAWHLVKGTFDAVDLAVYSFGAILPFIYFRKSLIIYNKLHEQQTTTRTLSSYAGWIFIPCIWKR
jgi:hypothetical protein